LCSEIANIINLPKKIRLEMGNNGRKHVLEKFSYPIITKQYLNILKDASELKKI
jgi:glycosyltransferase involved in cell wall biosynthesis